MTSVCRWCHKVIHFDRVFYAWYDEATTSGACDSAPLEWWHRRMHEALPVYPNR